MTGLRNMWAALGLCLILGPGVALAQDFIPAVGVASGADNNQATREAYYQAFRSELGRRVGDAAVAGTGESFRRAMDRDFEEFRDRYFSADTLVRCVPEATGVLCEVDGSINVAALRVDAIRELASAGGRSYTFVASAAESEDKRADFVIDRLTGEFAAYDHRVIFGSSANQAISNGDVNFSLAIYEASFSSFEYDSSLHRLSGALTVRFRLNDLQSGEALSVTPVAVSNWVVGDNPAALEVLLVEDLSEQAASEIARVVNSEILSYGKTQTMTDQADTLAAAGRAMFSLRVIGVDRRDAATRDRLRSLRNLLIARPGFSDVATDFTASSDSEMVINFTADADFSADAFVDALYAEFQTEPAFYADYYGGSEYEVSFK